ncbi:MAG: exosortase/archaeosortase family protein [Fibrobacter sp.]|nr:exosortase/archaeosortase family protein [Fibrobacter sp.]
MNSLSIKLSKLYDEKIVLFLGIVAASLVIWGLDLFSFAKFALDNESYNYVGLIPLVSGYFLWLSRNRFTGNNGNSAWGYPLIFTGVIVSLLSFIITCKDPVSTFSIKTTGTVLVSFGAFVMCWGWRGFKDVLFPMLFLVFAIPLSQDALNNVVIFLQHGSAVMVDWLFTLLGQTYIRNGVEFHLNSISISIAPECSGIRSTTALVVTCAVAVEMLLRNYWLKLSMFLLIIPFSLLKNAIRIVTITMLAEYVDTAFLTDSFLHHSGGIFFYLIVLAIYFPLLLVLAKSEKKRSAAPKSVTK